MPAAATLTFFPATASVGDPSATRTVYVTVILLVALAVALAVLAVWLFRRTRPEPQLLAPLEEMDSRAWRRQDPAGQRRALDASRPPGARPVHREAAEPAVDTDFATPRPIQSFDDLSDDPASNPSPVEADVENDADESDGHDDEDHADESDGHDADDDGDDGDDGDGDNHDDADAATDDDETVDFEVPDDDVTVDHQRSDDGVVGRTGSP